jgi:hypothetical protein
MPRSPDFFSQLCSDELNKLEAFAREPKATVDRVHEYLLAKGFLASRSAVGRWFKGFKERDRQSVAAEIADAIYSAQGDGATADIAGAVNLQIVQRLQSFLLKGGDKLPVGDLLKASMALGTITNAQVKLNDIKARGREQMQQLATAAKQRQITPEDIERISKKVFG